MIDFWIKFFRLKTTELLLKNIRNYLFKIPAENARILNYVR